MTFAVEEVSALHIDAEVFSRMYASDDLSPREKAVVAAVAFMRPSSITDLSVKLKMGRARVSATCKALVRKDWIRLVDAGGCLRKPVPWIPRPYQAVQVDQLYEDYDAAPLKAEFLLKKLLLFLVDRVRHRYNVRLEFMVNPLTGKRLELDCLIDGHAWEHNGEQHYRTTEIYSDPDEIRMIQARDLMKDSLSRKKGITVITVTTKDLSIEGIRKTIPVGMPCHYVDIGGPYARALERLCSSCRRAAARKKRAGAESRPGMDGQSKDVGSVAGPTGER